MKACGVRYEQGARGQEQGSKWRATCGMQHAVGAELAKKLSVFN